MKKGNATEEFEMDLWLGEGAPTSVHVIVTSHAMLELLSFFLPSSPHSSRTSFTHCVFSEPHPNEIS